MSQPPVHRHDQTYYFIENEGTVAPAATPSPRLLVPDVEKALEAEQPQEDAARALDPAEIEQSRWPALELDTLSCV